MIAKLKYIDLEYSDKDLEYIDYLKDNLDSICDEIVKFFNLDHLDGRINVKLFASLDEFREDYRKGSNGGKEVPKWICGFSRDGQISTLCLEEYNKTYSHEKNTLDDLLYLILHEFTHSIHYYVDKDLDKSYKWLREGLATTISHQYDNIPLNFNATLDDIKSGLTNYPSYHAMFEYVLNKYGKEYINKLINNHDFLYEETPKLYEEVKEIYNRNREIK